MKIYKKVFYLLSFYFYFFILSNNIHAQTFSNEQFLRSYQEKVRNIIKDNNDSNLNAQIFDISKRSFLNFLTSSTQYKKPGTQDIMGMQYYRDFKVNGRDTAFCFILYDSSSNLIQNYQNKTALNLDEITEYLVLHEMGHCFIMNYQYQNDISRMNPRLNEEVADKFVIYTLKKLGKNELIDKILLILSHVPPNDIHSNYRELLEFNDKLNNNEIENFKDNLSLIKYLSQ